MQVRPGIELSNLTDVGCQRENNEDYYCYWEPESEQEFFQKGRLAIIADGMGGNEAGEVASRLAVETVRDIYVNSPDGDPQSALLAGFRAAHETIRQAARENPQLQGMGTTCTAVAVTGDRLHFVHVGDSRLYLFRNGLISALTKDQSYVDRLVESGIITQEQARDHPQRHILTSALGVSGELSVEVSAEPFALEPADVLLLCTDGLYSMLTDEELLQVLNAQAPALVCPELVRIAKERGGPDNITVQILRVTAKVDVSTSNEVLVRDAKGRQP